MYSDFFKNIDNDTYYIFGWILNDLNIIKATSTLILKFPHKHNKLYQSITKKFSDIKPNVNDTLFIYNIVNIAFIRNLIDYIDEIIEKKRPIEFKNDFVRGFYENYGTLNYNESPELFLNGSYAEFISQVYDIPSINNTHFITFDNTNVVDFLGNIYNNSNESIILQHKYQEYIKLLGYSNSPPKCNIFRTDPNAIIPSKHREFDVGYDLTVIKFHKKLNDKTSLYDTGIKIQVQHGYYVEIVPRSSLSKSGYILANSIGIIDRGYTNNLYVALTKIDEKSPDITFPFRCCQLIFRKQEHFDITEVANDFNKTQRYLGGFGST